MKYLGTHNNRAVYWWEYGFAGFNELPETDWICFAIENGLPQGDLFEKFVRVSIQKKILEFKAFGKFSTHLDDSFDHILVEMEYVENYGEIDVMTTWHDDEGLASAFWQCFHATCLPDKTGLSNLKVVCFHFDNTDLSPELGNYIQKFNEGWLPSEDE